jgi:hypothetical protein
MTGVAKVYEVSRVSRVWVSGSSKTGNNRYGHGHGS